MINEFPKDFLWGAAVSAYQTEGGNTHCDWHEWEGKGHGKEPSGQACRHYELYEKDWDLAADLKLNSVRLSVEWSRIEPQEGQFDQKEIEHYVDVVRSLKKRGIEPLLTLHHFTNPLWLSKRGGWLHPRAPAYFRRFTEKIVPFLSPYVRYWATINEPNVYAYCGYVECKWPPQERSWIKAVMVQDNFMRGHVEAYRAIKKIYSVNKLPSPMVSLAQHLRGFLVSGSNPVHRLRARFNDYFFNFRFLDTVTQLKTMDYIGVNYYTCEFFPPLKKELPLNNLGWQIYPEGLFLLLLRLKRYKLPVMVLENGICTDDDKKRQEFIREHISSVKQAMLRGVNVTGYFYWSLIDNFEWEQGFGPRFGLIEVDYSTYQRRVRESALKYSEEICRNRPS
ncbi:MAG: family 1 glycosylhydrolase [Candidatus Omnitrophica bacterium]|nr:family 1 glycosylhydrolase [Candidatus Omnitrophota bacterium]MDD5655565.1 family 1 glycosylhydrolase [Candidatus Omnitrophota bacterium]